MRLVALSLVALLLVPLALAHGDDPEFDSGLLDQGETFEWVVSADHAEDVIAYHCHPHPWMTGEIHVTAGEGGAVHDIAIVEGDAQDINTWVFDPATIEVHPGDTVRWTNLGAIQHTATADVEDEEHGSMEGDNGTPGWGLPLVSVALAVVVLARRR